MASGELLAIADRPDTSQRTPSQRLLQAALMEYGNGWQRYDNQRDRSTGLGVSTGGGLGNGEVAHVISALWGTPVRVHGTQLAELFHKLGAPGDRLVASPAD